jgi:hypothetical protein
VIYPQYFYLKLNFISLMVGLFIQKYGWTFPSNSSSNKSQGNARLLDLKIDDGRSATTSWLRHDPSEARTSDGRSATTSWLRHDVGFAHMSSGIRPDDRILEAREQQGQNT